MSIHVYFAKGMCYLPYEGEYDEGPFHVVTVSMIREKRYAITNNAGIVKIEHHAISTLEWWCEAWNLKYAERIMTKGTAAHKDDRAVPWT